MNAIVVPSGDQAASPSSAPPSLVRFVRPLPSGLVIQTSIGAVAPGQDPDPPIPGPVKAIHSPSGDHVAFPPSAFGTGVTPLPSAFIVKSCCGPSRVESKINFPSGDHSG